MNNIWQGTRVRLRAIEPSDWEHLYNWNFDTDQARAVDRVWPNQSAESARRWAQEKSLERFSDGDYMWAIETLDGKFAGTINVWGCDRRVGTLKYGIAIHPDYRRRGFASEAVALVLRYYFQELRYQKAVATVYGFNDVSMRLQERMGFVLEGRLRRMVYTQGQYHDELYYGITREEFEETSCYRALPVV